MLFDVSLPTNLAEDEVFKKLCPNYKRSYELAKFTLMNLFLIKKNKPKDFDFNNEKLPPSMISKITSELKDD